MSNSSSNYGIGFIGVLTVAFIVLKLCNVIDWSWWIVLSPIWGELIVIAIIVIAYYIFLKFFMKKQ